VLRTPTEGRLCEAWSPEEYENKNDSYYKMQSLIEQCDNNNILYTETGQPEKSWTKMDTVQYMMANGYGIRSGAEDIHADASTSFSASLRSSSVLRTYEDSSYSEGRRMSPEEYDEIMNSEQHQATMIMIKKNNTTTDFVNDWYNCSQIYHLIDDSPSISANYPGFVEHRHDQSIFSLLLKSKKYQHTMNNEHNSIKDPRPILLSRKRNA
jgi:hypothetical protein